MKKTNLNGTDIFQFDLLSRYKEKLEHAVFTRTIDPSEVSAIQKTFGSAHEPYQFSNQLHGIKHTLIKKLPADESTGDILITNQSQLPIVIRVADCGSILFYDPEYHVIANIHAGWRGIAQKIIPKTISLLEDAFGTKRTDLIACLSPMIGPCCCVFTDPKKELPSFLHPYILEENYVDLWSAVEGQLIGSGLSKEHVEVARICTVCTPEEFHSHRRDKEKAGRFCTGIMLK